MENAIFKETNEQGEVVREVLGVSKIFDPVLLEEIIQYNDQGNFDRIVAAELAIAQALKMDPIMGKIGGTSDERVTSMFKKKRGNVLFTDARGDMFGRSKNKYKRNKLFS
jgi:hypothetical protein